MIEGQRVLLEKLIEILLSRRGASPHRNRYKLLKNIDDMDLRKRQTEWYLMEEKILFIFMLVVVCGLTCTWGYQIDCVNGNNQLNLTPERIDDADYTRTPR